MPADKSICQAVVQALPYPLVWVEQQAEGTYQFYGLNPAWERVVGQDGTPLLERVAQCLRAQTPQAQPISWQGQSYWLQSTPVSATTAVGWLLPVPPGAVVEEAPVLLWVADAQGQVTYVNRHWTVLTGWPVERVLGKNWFDLVHPEEQAMVAAMYHQAVRDGVPYRVEFRLSCADHSRRWLACTGQPRYHAQGEPVGLVGCCVDITASKQAEQFSQAQGDANQFLVRLSTEILESLEVTPVMQCAVDELRQLLGADRVAITPVRPDGSVYFAVEAVRDPQFQMLHTQIQDHCFTEQYLERYRQGRVLAIADVATAPIEPCHRELLQRFGVQANLVVPIRQRESLWGLLIVHQCTRPHIWQQGEIALVQQVANYLGLALHRTELVERLCQQEARYREIVDAQSELICRHDPQGRLTFANPALCRYLGQTAAQVLQRSPQELALAVGEQPLRRGNGELGWVAWQAQEIRNDQGELLEMQWVGRDVTQAHRVQERLQLMEAVVVCANDGIVITRGQQVIYANPTFLAMTGYGFEEIQRLGLGELCGEKTDLTQWEYLQNSRKQGASVRVELVQYTKQHEDFWVELTVLSLSDSARADTAQDEWVWVYRDITARKQMEAQLLYEAYHDALTGLPNRNFLMDRLHQVHQRALQAGTYYAVLFADLDRFKLVNDSLGHAVGDEMLQQVARRLQAQMRPGDVLARLGGDEFVVLLEPVTGVGQAVAIAETLLRVLQQPFVVQGRELVVSTSIGVCLNDDPDASPADILRNADIAMYRVKLAGRCGVEVFRPGMHAQLKGQLELETALRQGLAQQELLLHYQPVVDVRRGTIVGFEALVRWQRPGVGLVSPGVFIPIAEESELIYPLSQWVLHTASAQLARWRQVQPDLTLAVNVSGRLFRRAAEWVNQVRDTLRQWQLPPQSLVLEVTEGVLMADPQTVGQALNELRQEGVRVSIDDFGTGYSSLARLQGLPVDSLKIDRSFIRHMGQTDDLVQAIVTLALTLDKEVVVEGIETEEQVMLLRRFSPQAPLYGQGYWFAPPLSAAAATALLQHPVPWHLP